MLAGPHGVLAGVEGPLLLLIGSTSSPEGVRALGARLEPETDGLVHVVDCPVSGGVDGATAGTLSIMLGGAEADVALAGHVLAPCGRPVALGPLGAGEIAKACHQMIVSATVLALGEAAVLAERSGLDLGKLFDLLSGGYADSRVLATRRKRIVAQDYSPAGAAKYMAKDLDVAQALAASTGTHPALAGPRGRLRRTGHRRSRRLRHQRHAPLHRRTRDLSRLRRRCPPPSRDSPLIDAPHQHRPPTTLTGARIRDGSNRWSQHLDRGSVTCHQQRWVR